MKLVRPKILGTLRRVVIWSFYTGGFMLALALGLCFGFTDSHTPPLPFLLELFIIPVGIIWLMADIIILMIRKEKQWEHLVVHFVGLVVNGLLMMFIFTKEI